MEHTTQQPEPPKPYTPEEWQQILKGEITELDHGRTIALFVLLINEGNQHAAVARQMSVWLAALLSRQGGAVIIRDLERKRLSGQISIDTKPFDNGDVEVRYKRPEPTIAVVPSMPKIVKHPILDKLRNGKLNG